MQDANHNVIRMWHAQHLPLSPSFFTRPLGSIYFWPPDGSCTQMSVQRFHRWRSGLLRMLSSSHTIYPLIRANSSGPYMGSTISSYAVLQEQSCLRISITTNFKSLGILHGPHDLYSATTMHQQNPQKVRLISLLDAMERGDETLWDDRFP